MSSLLPGCHNRTTTKCHHSYQAAIVLHNVLCTNESSVHCPPGFTNAEDGVGNILQGEWRSQASEDSGLSRLGKWEETDTLNLRLK